MLCLANSKERQYLFNRHTRFDVTTMYQPFLIFQSKLSFCNESPPLHLLLRHCRRCLCYHHLPFHCISFFHVLIHMSKSAIEELQESIICFIRKQRCSSVRMQKSNNIQLIVVRTDSVSVHICVCLTVCDQTEC